MPNRRNTVSVLLLLLLCIAPTIAAQAQTADEIAKLQGEWTVVAAEQRGKPFDAIKGGRLTIQGTTFTLRTAAGNEFSGTIRVNPSSTPKQLDFHHADSGPVWAAIYSVTEDLFRLNYVEAGGRDPRPTIFATSGDSAGTVIAMSRTTPRR